MWNKIVQTLTIISTLGMIFWMMSEFFDGMFDMLLSYPVIIGVFVHVYVISLIITIIKWIRFGYQSNKILVLAHVNVVVAMLGLWVYHTDILKSKRVFTANLQSSIYAHTLILRENGKCEDIVTGVFGYRKVFRGTYALKGDTVKFIKKPYDTDFIPQQALWSKPENKLYLRQDSTGKFITNLERNSFMEIVVEE